MAGIDEPFPAVTALLRSDSSRRCRLNKKPLLVPPRTRSPNGGAAREPACAASPPTARPNPAAPTTRRRPRGDLSYHLLFHAKENELPVERVQHRPDRRLHRIAVHHGAPHEKLRRPSPNAQLDPRDDHVPVAHLHVEHILQGDLTQTLHELLHRSERSEERRVGKECRYRGVTDL